MKKSLIFMFSVALVFAGCSNDELVNDSVAQKAAETPIGFNVKKQNITRGTTALEANGHYNFGVWAYKGNNTTAPVNEAEVMGNYLVGYGASGAYNPAATTADYTYNSSTSTQTSNTDHKSPWFYQGLGMSEYPNADGYYKTTDTQYMSNNANQYLRYWDLAYTNTNFYCYAPYFNSSSAPVTFNSSTNDMTFPSGSIRDGYDDALNSSYSGVDRSLSEFMVGGVTATNAYKQDVTVNFKHMGAQLFIRFYEDIPGYRVKILELGDGFTGTWGSSVTADQKKGIQATPAKAKTAPNDYDVATYSTTNGATVNFSSITDPTITPSYDTEVSTNLMFKIPTASVTWNTTNLESATINSATVSNLIFGKASSGTQTYSYSPTIYYPVAQNTTSTTGFTFHVSYQIIAEDNGETITVNNATVHVPYKGTASINGAAAAADQKITVWQPNVKYTYTFKITKDSNGTTDPSTDIDPSNPDTSDKVALYPIVFDNATITDYDTNVSEYIISDDSATGY